VSVESSQVRIGIPEPIRTLGQLPSTGGTVVVFAFVEILELWTKDAWFQWVRELARERGSVIAEAIEQLRDR
jgi:hypothetical protein